MLIGVAFLMAYVIMFYSYYTTGRKSLLYYSFGWLTLSIHHLRPAEGVYNISIAFFAFFLWLGNIKMGEELLKSVPYHRELKLFSFLPIAALLFLTPLHEIGALSMIAASIVIASIFLIMSREGQLVQIGLLEGVFGIMGGIVGVLGESGMLHALSSMVALIAAYLSTRHLLATAFKGSFEVENAPSDFPTGMVVLPTIARDILMHALVFSRQRGSGPNWFWITKATEENAVSPTNLPKILDISLKFMKHASDEGKRPLIVLEGVEYLILENDFNTVAKFLSTLRDYAILHGASVVILSDLKGISEKERNFLLRLVGDEGVGD